MKKETWVVLALLILAMIAILFLIQGRTANLVLDLQKTGSYAVGEDLSGVLAITIEKDDVVKADTPVLVNLIDSKDNVLDTKILTLKEFMEKADNVPPISEVDGKMYYQTVGKYRVNVNDVIKYTFQETGNYDLVFAIFELDILTKKKIVVE